MAEINLLECFPVGKDGEQGPLPKQNLFLDSALDEDGHKYIRYVGGIGSGKSLIGCITVLSCAILHEGDYLIGRQFMPELRDTTYKTFLDICPPELIVEHRVADAIVKLRTVDGGVANIYFRGLEDADKLRSMNLNLFYIDEANQVSEYAFMLLQGRLRGKWWRKGLITQNSGGHDWSWRWFVKQDMFSKEATKAKFLNIVAPSTENHHLPEGYIETMMDTWSEDRILRELMANEDAFEGMVYSEFRQDVHVIKPFAIPDTWKRIVGADHGFRNPAAWIWGAVDPDDNVYIYREFYKREWSVDEIVKGKKDKFSGKRVEPGVLHLMKKEKIDGIYIDPSTDSMTGKKGGTIYEEYLDLLPGKYALLKAKNKKEPGINKVKQYLKVNATTKKPQIFFFNTCVSLIDEICTYQYAELPVTQRGKQNEKEEPKKVNDHACDALRYLIMSRPEAFEDRDDWYEKNNVKYGSIEGHLHRDLESAKGETAQEPDPFGDY